MKCLGALVVVLVAAQAAAGSTLSAQEANRPWPKLLPSGADQEASPVVWQPESARAARLTLRHRLDEIDLRLDEIPEGWPKAGTLFGASGFAMLALAGLLYLNASSCFVGSELFDLSPPGPQPRAPDYSTATGFGLLGLGLVILSPIIAFIVLEQRSHERATLEAERAQVTARMALLQPLARDRF